MGSRTFPHLRTSLETTISGRITIEGFEVEHFSHQSADDDAQRAQVYRPHSKTRQILTGWLQCQPDNRSKR